MGTGCFFQGFPVSALQLNRARGVEATPSVIEILVDGWDSLQVVPPPGDADPFNPPRGDDRGMALSGALGRLAGTRDARLALPSRIQWGGYLGLCEVDAAGNQFGPHEIGPLFVTRATSVRRSADGRISRVRLFVADARFWWALGGLPLWSFNRRRPGGTIARDSLQEDGAVYTAREILRLVLSGLAGSPKLSRVPARLQGSAGPVELSAGAPAIQGLNEATLRFGVSEPCLQWDGQVAVYDRGEGHVGFSPTGASENTEQVPVAHLLDKGGTAYGREVQLGYPPQYVRVVGGPRIATVAIDGWEPVLHLPRAVVRPREGPAQQEAISVPAAGQGGRAYYPLTEEILRRIVPTETPPGGAATWLEWLKVWVLGPRTSQGIPGLSPEVSRLLAEQAWRLWRMPGTEDRGGVPGFNAHLLPLQARAETIDGRRQPVTVEAYGFAPVHWQFQGTSKAEVLKHRQELDRIRKEVLSAELAQVQAGTLPVTAIGDAGQGGPGRRGDEPLRGSELRPLLGSAVDPLLGEELHAALKEVRYIARATQAAPSLASAYERTLTDLYRLQGDGYRLIVFNFAKEVLRVEDEARGRKNIRTMRHLLLDSPELVSGLRRQAETMSREALNLKRAAELRSRTGAEGPSLGPHTPVFFENKPRSADPGARVYDAEAGVVQTSRVAGWLEKPRVAVAHASTLVPKPVRVLFGATLRPRCDLLPGEFAQTAPQPRPRTGGDQPEAPANRGDGGEGNFVPQALTDRETFYVAAFRRTTAGPELVDDTPDLVGKALTIRHRELVELVPVVGEGNKADLFRQSAEIARGAMDRPEIVTERRFTLGRPFLVQTDGLVSGVQIRMRPNCAGFETAVEIGTQRPSFAPLGTRERRKPAEPGTPDAVLREGLT